MSRPIDEKIISMKLENKDFEDKARQSLNTLSRLDGGLPSGGKNAAKGLDTIGKSVDTIASKFTNLGIVGTTALMNITNKAVNAGLNLLNKFTLKPITDGFTEYETKMKSIQTIKANTGREIGDIEKSLQSLNLYADKTVYNFAQMTSNLGLFTNAGLELEESTKMIQGFMNVAAASGSTNEQAQRAAFQLSQGLSQGMVRLMDWRSLTQAGMGNANMREGLVKIADSMGVLSKKGMSATDILSNFEGTLKENWLTADVMSQYLNIMTNELDDATLASMNLSKEDIAWFKERAKDAEEAATKVRTFTQLLDTAGEAIGSKWSEIFNLVIGNFDDATERFTAISEAFSMVVNGIFDPIIAFLTQFKNAGGIAAIWNGLGNIGKAIGGVFGIIVDAIKFLIPNIGGGKIALLAKGFEAVTKALVPSADTLKTIKNVIITLLTPIKILFGVVRNLAINGFNFLTTIINQIPFDKISAKVKILIDFTKALAKDGFGKLKGIFSGAKDWGKGAGDTIIQFFKGIGSMKIWADIAGAIETASVKMEEFSDRMNQAGEDIKGKFKPVTDTLNQVREFVWKIIKQINLKDIFKGASLVTAWKFIKAVIAGGKKLGNAIENISKGIENLTEVFKGTGELMGQMKKNLKVVLIKDLAYALLILAGALYIMSKVPSESIGTSLGILTGGLIGLSGAMTLIQRMKIDKDFKTGKFMTMIMGLALALGAIAVSMRILSKADPNALLANTISLSILLGGVVMITKLLKEEDILKVFSFAAGMKQIAKAMTWFAISMQIMGRLKPEQLKRGLLAVSGLLVAFGLFTKLTSGSELYGVAGVILAIAAAVNLMMPPILILAFLPVKRIISAVGAISGLLLAFTLFSKYSKGSNLKESALGILAMSGALMALTTPIMLIAMMPVEGVAVAIIAMAAAIGILVGAAYLAKPVGPSLLRLGAAMKLFGVGMLAFGAGLALTMAALSGAVALGPGLVDGLVLLITGLIRGLKESVITLAQAFVDLIMESLRLLDKHMEEFIDLVINILVKVMDGVANRMGELTGSFVKLANALGKALATVFVTVKPIDILAIVLTYGAIAGLMKTIKGVKIADLIGALKGVAVTSAVLVEIMAMMSVIGMIYGLPGVKEWVATGGQFLKDLAAMLGGVIGAFIGHLAGAMTEGFTDHLEGIANNLNKFIDAIQPFIEKSKKFTAADLAGVKALVDIVSVVAGATLKNAVANLIGWVVGKDTSLETFGKNIVSLADAMVDYCEVIGGLPSDALDKVTNSVSALEALANLNDHLPKLGGVIGFWEGEPDMETFGEGLPLLGSGLLEYSKSIAELPADAVEKITASVEALHALSGVNNSLTNIGGIVGFWEGDPDMEAFGTGLPLLGKGLTDYSNSIAGANMEAVAASIPAVESLVAINNALENTGVLKSLFKGKKDLGAFARNLETFGGAIKVYSNTVTDLNIEAIALSTAAIKAIIAIDTSKAGSFTTLGTALIGFGDNVKLAIEKITSVSIDQVPQAVASIERLIDKLNALGDIDISKITTLKTALSEVGTIGIEELRLAFVNGMDEIGPAIEGLVTDMSDKAVALAKDKTRGVGRTHAEEFAAGIRSRVTPVEDAGVYLVTSMKTKMGEYSFTSVGQNAASGVATGLELGYGTVYRSAYSLGMQVAAGIKAALQIRSPSRVTRKSGIFSGEGLVEGLKEMFPQVFKTATSLGDKVKEGIAGVADGFVALANSSFDIQPEVTPILNLDNWGELPGLSANVAMAGGPALSSDINLLRNVEARGLTRDVIPTAGVVNNYSVNNEKLLDGAVFHVREEADMPKVAREIARMEADKARREGRRL